MMVVAADNKVSPDERMKISASVRGQTGASEDRINRRCLVYLFIKSARNEIKVGSDRGVTPIIILKYFEDNKLDITLSDIHNDLQALWGMHLITRSGSKHNICTPDGNFRRSHLYRVPECSPVS